jgi:CheY-like chemotaxis protein
LEPRFSGGVEASLRNSSLNIVVGSGMGQQKDSHFVVLIVEDDALTLMDAVEFVTEAGFDVVTAKNADAISILESRDDIRVIFTDVSMPGSMGGLKLAQTVRNRAPRLISSSPRD